MRVVTQSVLLLTLFTGRSLGQASPTLPAPERDPFVGTWKADANKSRPKLDKDKASYTRTISREGDEIIFSSRAKKPYGGFSENHYRIRCDALPHRVPCGQASCTTSCAYKAPNRVEGETAGPDGETSYWTREVSSDGREMRVFEYEGKARAKLKAVVVNDRVN